MSDPSKTPAGRHRILIAIACYGQRNLPFLKRLIAAYRAMPFDVHIVVLSEAPKDVGPGAEVRAGLPSPNPWSLPFAHKALFAERIEDFDLFIYSEDDMEVTEANLRSFLRLTHALPPDEIAGFLRYEMDAAGTQWFPEFHGPYHWLAGSVRDRGEHVVAEFSNEHAAFFILTREQLRRAIASGGFLREPYEGRHDMLCAAATDPYTSCGFRKVVCISEVENFLIHHLSNRYAGRLGLNRAQFNQQIETLFTIRAGRHPITTLCETECRILRGDWSKNFYEEARPEVLNLVPDKARTILSVGCGSGAAEGELARNGRSVAALPLDSVIADAAPKSIEMIYGTLEEGLASLKGRVFDCVLISRLLHLLADPWTILRACANCVAPGGSIVIASPNFDLLPVRVRRALGKGDYALLRSHAESGVYPIGVGPLKRQLSKQGFRLSETTWFQPTRRRWQNLRTQPFLRRWLVTDWALRADLLNRG